MATLGKVVIAGGGVGGLTTALALRRVGVDVEVHEKYPQPQGRATGFTIWSYSIKQLTALGLERDVLDRIGSAIEVTEIRNQAGDLLEQMPVGEVSAKLGAPSYDIRRDQLQAALIALLPAGTVHMGSEVAGVEGDADAATAILADGSRVRGDLLIGADGIHSVVRTYVVGERPLRYSGYTAVGAVIPFDSPQYPTHRHVEIWAKGSKGGIADVGDGHVRWYVTRKVPAEAGHAFPKAAVLEHIRDWYDLLREAVEATDAADTVVSEAWDLAPLPTWIKGRVVLLGDAAHATTPFAAMGANMAIGDAVSLAELVTSDRPLAAALQEFQDSRKKRTEEVVKHGRTMGRLQQLHAPLLAWMRDQFFLHVPPDKLEEITRGMAAGE